MDLSRDTLDRIFVAANSLYDESGRAAFPTVDSVRKTARVNMNDASTGMKQWRRAQMNQTIPIAVQIPELVQQASAVALAALWRTAQELATESLRAAQSGWDAERAESDALSQQMADAYDGKSAELETVQAVIVQLQNDAGRRAVDKARLEDALDVVRGELAAATAVAERFEARAIEIERRASELRTELDRAHHEMDKAQAEIAAMREEHAKKIEAYRSELASVRAKWEGERDKSQQGASMAREEAAILRGQVEAMKEQIAAMYWLVPTPGTAEKPQELR